MSTQCRHFTQYSMTEKPIWKRESGTLRKQLHNSQLIACWHACQAGMCKDALTFLQAVLLAPSQVRLRGQLALVKVISRLNIAKPSRSRPFYVE